MLLRRNYGCYDVTKTCEITLRNYVTKLRYEITLRNYITKLLRETKKNRNYVTFWRIRNHEVKVGGLNCGKYPLMVISAVYSTEITRNYVMFRFRKWL